MSLLIKQFKNMLVYHSIMRLNICFLAVYGNSEWNIYIYIYIFLRNELHQITKLGIFWWIWDMNAGNVCKCYTLLTILFKLLNLWKREGGLLRVCVFFLIQVILLRAITSFVLPPSYWVFLEKVLGISGWYLILGTHGLEKRKGRYKLILTLLIVEDSVILARCSRGYIWQFFSVSPMSK